jgi:uncharacterized oxidoreductase
MNSFEQSFFFVKQMIKKRKMKLNNITVLITGGSSGIGLQLAKVLLRQSCKVLICGRSQAKLEQAESSVKGLNTFQCDLALESERVRLFRWVSENHPECSILINNAAIVHRTSFADDDAMTARAELEIQTNLMAPISLSKLFLPLLAGNKSAAIINITTGLVYAPKYAYPVYSASKSGLHIFTQVLRKQLQEKNIKIIEVLLPVVDTPWHNGTVPASAISAEEAVKEMVLKIEKGESEIQIGKVRLLYYLSRLSPGLARKIINRL